MNARIYYTEPYRTTFEATVTGVEQVAGQTHVMLDQTAFYPTSGGQPHDTGTLGGAAVVDVVDRDDGAIAHVVSGDLRAGEVVEGRIDWARRFDHMQQHTGQHVLSAAFDRLCGARTESFHLGAESSTIDLARELSPQEIARAEDEANRIVWEDRAVSIRFASAEEAAAMPLRKESARTGALRLIDVQDFDLSACGGTHVERTGAIGVIAIGGWEKFRGGSRVEFLCGNRALQRFRSWRDALALMQKHLSVAPAEMPASIERLQAEGKGLQRTIRAFQEKLASHEAHSLLAKTERVGERLIVAEAMEGWDAQGLKGIAASVASQEPKSVVALFTTASPPLAVIARGAEANADAGALFKSITTRFGGKGGGKPDLAQGGGFSGTAVEWIAAIRELLR